MIKKNAEPIANYQRISIDPADKGNIGICLNIYGCLYFHSFKSYNTKEMYKWTTEWINTVEEMIIEMGNIYYTGCACNSKLQLFRESLVVYAENQGIKVKYCNVGYVAASQIEWSGSINRKLTKLGYREKLEQAPSRKLTEDEWNAGIMDWIATNQPELLTKRMEVEKFVEKEGKCKKCRSSFSSRDEALTNYYQSINQKKYVK